MFVLGKGRGKRLGISSGQGRTSDSYLKKGQGKDEVGARIRLCFVVKRWSGRTVDMRTIPCYSCVFP